MQTTPTEVHKLGQEGSLQLRVIAWGEETAVTVSSQQSPPSAAGGMGASSLWGSVHRTTHHNTPGQGSSRYALEAQARSPAAPF